MNVFRQQLPDNNELSDQGFVKTIESLIGYRLSSYPLYIANSIGFALFVSIGVFVITFISYLLIISDPDIKNEFVYAITDSSQFFVLMVFTWFLNLVGPIWFKRCLEHYERSTVMFVGFISIVALALCIFLSINYLTPSTPEQENMIDGGGTYVCDDLGRCNTSAGAVNTDTGMKRDDSFNVADSLDNHSLVSDETQFEMLNKLLEKYEIDDFDLTERIEFIESVFTDISLLKDSLNKKKIEDWDAFFLELDSVAATKPAYVDLAIYKGITNGAPFDVVVEILNRGHTLSTAHISRLASRLSVSELTILENNHGVEYTDGLILVSALRNPDNKGVYDYLLAKNQFVFSDEVDVFREVLERTSILRLDLSFARKVLQAGAPVTNETAAWIEGGLKQEYYGLYKSIKEELSI